MIFHGIIISVVQEGNQPPNATHIEIINISVHSCIFAFLQTSRGLVPWGVPRSISPLNAPKCGNQKTEAKVKRTTVFFRTNEKLASKLLNWW